MLLKPWRKAPAKGRAFPARKLVRLSSGDLQQIRLIALVGFTDLLGLRSDNWKAWLSLKWRRRHFQESLEVRIPLARRPHFFLKIISVFKNFLKENLESLQREVELYSHQINYSVFFKIPVGKACYVMANSHRPYTNAFSGNCLCNNKLLVGKWRGFSQAMHSILFTLILMEKFPVSLVGADLVQGCGKLDVWICLNCKVSLLLFRLILYLLVSWFTLRFCNLKLC